MRGQRLLAPGALSGQRPRGQHSAWARLVTPPHFKPCSLPPLFLLFQPEQAPSPARLFVPRRGACPSRSGRKAPPHPAVCLGACQGARWPL